LTIKYLFLNSHFLFLAVQPVSAPYHDVSTGASALAPILAPAPIFILYGYVATFKTSVAELHHFYAAPAPGKNLDAAPAAPAAPLRLLPYCIARQNFENELKLKQMLKLSRSFDSVRFILIKYELNGL
jgi:hypothetical protein